MSNAAMAYLRPNSLAEACALGRRLGADGAFLAGGTELLPDYHRERESARHLIALDGVAELHGIRAQDGLLRIGALTSIAEVARSPLVGSWFPALSEAARVLGSAQIRSLATIGGNFCRAVPCADTPPVAIVGESRVRTMSPDGAREIDAEHFFVGPRCTALGPGEVVVEIVVPAQPSCSGASYQRFARRRGAALAVAAVAARVVLDGASISSARIALGAAAPVPLLAARAMKVLEGESVSDELFALAGALCAEEALPVSDIRGSAGFRRELVNVLTRRALAEAVARAREVQR
jgi:aerobic carbon-monoxide dehydrogenase medium subunit